jgi:hypothetical protein
MACLLTGSPLPFLSSLKEEEDGLSLSELMEVTSEGEMPRFGWLPGAENEGPKGLVMLSGVGRLYSFVGCCPWGGMNQPLVLLERLCSESGDTGTPLPLPFKWRWEPGIMIAEGRPGGEWDETELWRRARVVVRVGPTDGARERERERDVPIGEGVCRVCPR